MCLPKGGIALFQLAVHLPACTFVLRCSRKNYWLIILMEYNEVLRYGHQVMTSHKYAMSLFRSFTVFHCCWFLSILLSKKLYP